MIVYSDVTIVANIQSLAFTQHTLCTTLGQFLAVMSGFAVMPEFGGAPLSAIEIDYLIAFWESK